MIIKQSKTDHNATCSHHNEILYNLKFVLLTIEIETGPPLSPQRSILDKKERRQGQKGSTTFFSSSSPFCFSLVHFGILGMPAAPRHRLNAVFYDCSPPSLLPASTMAPTMVPHDGAPRPPIRYGASFASNRYSPRARFSTILCSKRLGEGGRGGGGGVVFCYCGRKNNRKKRGQR
jgi:hypothetical protein